jgi:hypothetical protein
MLRCKASYIKQPKPPQPEPEPTPPLEPIYYYKEEYQPEEVEGYVSDIHVPIMVFIIGFITLALLHPLE